MFLYLIEICKYFIWKLYEFQPVVYAQNVKLEKCNLKLVVFLTPPHQRNVASSAVLEEPGR